MVKPAGLYKCSLIVTDGKMLVDFGNSKVFHGYMPDNLSKMAVVDPQDLHLHGIRWRLTDDSILSVTLPMELIAEIVSKVLKHWWHLKLVMYLSLHRPFVLRYSMK